MMNCSDTSRLLDEVLEGRSSQEVEAEALAHIRSCPNCRARFKAVLQIEDVTRRRVSSALAAALVGIGNSPLARGIEVKRLRRQVAARTSRRTFALGIARTGGALVLGAFLGWQFIPRTSHVERQLSFSADRHAPVLRVSQRDGEAEGALSLAGGVTIVGPSKLGPRFAEPLLRAATLEQSSFARLKQTFTAGAGLGRAAIIGDADSLGDAEYVKLLLSQLPFKDVDIIEGGAVSVDQLSGYSTLVVIATALSTASLREPLIDLVQQGRGIVIVGPSASILCTDPASMRVGEPNSTNLTQLKRLWGLASYTNVRGDALSSTRDLELLLDNPLGVNRPAGFHTDSRAAAGVVTKDDSATVIARWSDGSAFAFVRDSGYGRVAFTSLISDHNNTASVNEFTRSLFVGTVLWVSGRQANIHFM